MKRRIGGVAAAVWLGAALSGCGSDFWYGDSDEARAEVATPEGVQTGDVSISYTLTGEMSTVDVSVVYSTNGVTFQEATPAPGSEGTDDLTVSPDGAPHTFTWRTGEDLANDREGSVLIRVRPDEGVSDTTGPIPVHNARFLASVRNQAEGEVRMHRVDAVGGALTFLEAEPTGGMDPQEIVYHGGHYLVPHAGTNNVAVLALDTEAGSLTAVTGSPFAGDGSGSKYLATDGKFVFVSNVTGGTITIYDWNTSTKALSLNLHSGQVAFGCRGLAAWNSRLYVASETSGTIVIFDIAIDGRLSTNPASPVSSGGLLSPRELALGGTRLYAANFAEASIAGFNVEGSGALAPITGSPFTASSDVLESLVRNGSKLFAVNGTGASLLSFTIDASGALAEDATSSFPLSGPSFGVASAGMVTLAPTTTPRKIEVFLISSTGVVTAHPSGPVDAGVELRRTALSD